MLNAENPFKGFFISKETFSFISLSISLRNFYITNLLYKRVNWHVAN
jgi:hypothetical protein